MATVLLLRHGRTSTNAGGTLAGHQPVELDDVGRAQAQAFGARLAAAGLPLAAVVSSPLIRCRQTLALALPAAVQPDPAGPASAPPPGAGPDPASPAPAGAGLNHRGRKAGDAVAAPPPVVFEERLIECRYGDWTGQPLKKLAKDPLWTVVQTHPSAARFPGADAESMAEMATRAVAAVRDWDARVTAEHGPEAIWLACSHGDVIKAIIADALGMHLDLFQRIAVDPASVTVIRYTPLRPFVLRSNDSGGDLAPFKPVKPSRRRRSRTASDAPVGGGAGGTSAG